MTKLYWVPERCVRNHIGIVNIILPINWENMFIGCGQKQCDSPVSISTLLFKRKSVPSCLRQPLRKDFNLWSCDMFFFFPKEIQVQNETKRTTILFELMNLKICFLMVPIRILMKQKHLTNHEYPGLYFYIPFSLKGNWAP